MLAERELLFSITRKDLEEQHFRAGGKGGQKQNKTSSGVRLIHKDSGARGEARDSRHQHVNRKNAFKRLISSNQFQVWMKLEISRKLGVLADMEKRAADYVEDQMNEGNLKIEYL